MKRLLIIAALALSCTADLLLPGQRAPQNAYQSGGGDFLGSQKNTYIPPKNQYLPPTNQYLPPTNQYLPPQKPATPAPRPPPSKPTNSYLPPQNNYLPPQNNYLPPQNNYSPPQNNYSPPQNNYLPPSGPTTPPVPILKQVNELHEDGSYNYEFLTGDQTHVQQMGHIENLGTDHEEQVMHGSYSYVGDDGKTYTVRYVAGANGFEAYGDHLPTPPPIPPEIQKGLDLIAAAEANKGNQGYPSGGPQGYPSGGPQGYPSGKPDQTYLPPQQPNRPSYNPSSGYQY